MEAKNILVPAKIEDSCSKKYTGSSRGRSVEAKKLVHFKQKPKYLIAKFEAGSSKKTLGCSKKKLAEILNAGRRGVSSTCVRPGCSTCRRRLRRGLLLAAGGLPPKTASPLRVGRRRAAAGTECGWGKEEERVVEKEVTQAKG